MYDKPQKILYVWLCFICQETFSRKRTRIPEIFFYIPLKMYDQLYKVWIITIISLDLFIEITLRCSQYHYRFIILDDLYSYMHKNRAFSSNEMVA